ncbi:MAG: extracellular solute-binding protein [Treponema sp.]|nr:extracellular solute-binding protein [Treponema sp.]
MYLKQKLCFVVVLCISTGLLFASGNTQQQSIQSAGGPTTLVVGMQTNPNILDYKDNYQTRYVEKMNNISIDFYMLPNILADARSKVALLVSSGDLPDVLQMGLATEAALEYGSNGAIIDQTSYLMDKTKSPNFWNIPEADRNAMLVNMKAADGKIYNQLIWQPESWNLTAHRQYINKAWLDKLGLKTPVTTDELRNVLSAFRNQDPNGNGKQDELGVYGWFGGTYGENVTAGLINSFVFYNKDELALDDAGNKVIAPFVQPGFRQALQYLSSLRQNGLLEPSLFTNNQQEYRAALAANPSVVGFVSAGSVGNWVDADNNANFLQLAMIPPLKGPAGLNYTPYTGFIPGAVGYISSTCKVKDVAWKYLDSFYDHDLSIIVRFGEEGVDWTRDPNVLASQTNAYVSAGLYPKITIVETSLVWNNPNNTIWGNPGPRYASEEQGNTRGSLTRPFVPESKVAILDAYNYQWYVPNHPKFILPPLKFTLAEAQKIGAPITDVRNFVQQAIAEFTVGTRDINNDTAWNTYLRELDNLGLQQWLTTAQAAYDRSK